MLAQLLDRGDVADWTVLYRLAAEDAELRRRIKRIVATVPMPFPHFWRAALASLGETVDYGIETPSYFEHSGP